MKGHVNRHFILHGGRIERQHEVLICAVSQSPTALLDLALELSPRLALLILLRRLHAGGAVTTRRRAGGAEGANELFDLYLRHPDKA